MNSDQTIPMPQPPMCTHWVGNEVKVGEHVVITLLDGHKVVGALRNFDTEKGVLNVLGLEDTAVTIYELKTIKIMNLPNLRHWSKSEAPNENFEEAISLSNPKQEFEINFTDGDNLLGDTLGFRLDRHGIFLFPAQTINQYIYTFIPHDAIDNYHVGPRIGEVLVSDNLVSKEQIESVLTTQSEERNRPLGEILKAKAIFTAMDLERALEKQKSAPNLRLGEILTSENLISEEQLEEALKSQKKDRKKPLGEILVDLGLVNKAQIQSSLAKKLGIPFVDLQKFDISPEVINIIPENLVRKYSVLPLYIYDKKLVVSLENPMDWDALDAIRFHTNLYIEPVMAELDDIEATIDLVYSTAGIMDMSLDDIDVGIDETTVFEDTSDEVDVSDNLVVKLVNKIIIDAHRQGASDIHIEPYPGKGKTVIRIRKDGTLVNYYKAPPSLRKSLVARIKIMAGLDISERRKPQDGKIDFKKFSELKIELRVATIPTVGHQEDVVMRILAAGKPIPINELGLSEINRKRLLRTIKKPYGLFFVCGPTGSGKTTTLHSILGHLNTPETKIWTAEDPVEITQKGLRQLQVQPKIGLTFAAAMRAFLRADPDIIMVGEMRDLETTKMGVEASLTGHLVMATLHTNSAPESIIRLLDMGMDPFNFADALLGVLAQRLTKKLCPSCREAYAPDEEEIRELLMEYCNELIEKDNSKKEEAEQIYQNTLADWKKQYAPEDGTLSLNRAVGCGECEKSGYRGRMAIHEILEVSDLIKRQILDGAKVSELLTTSLKEGMRTLKQDGIEKVLAGETDILQIRRVCIK